MTHVREHRREAAVGECSDLENNRSWSCGSAAHPCCCQSPFLPPSLPQSTDPKRRREQDAASAQPRLGMLLVQC